ncbi:MAG: SIR2 family protein [Chloroflexi bacterium]|nr:SIR2 family protein [Chloroflexota bacterium]
MEALNSARDGGVAFLGAGASAPAGFPSWAKFHEDFLAHFEAKPAPDPDPGSDFLTDIDYHTNREPARALDFVKGVFATPVAQIPPLVNLVCRTRSLRYFYTTNLDEVLLQAAQGRSVAVYPDYVPMSARFIYLHGRASTAGSVHNDLVLGTRGYARAYGDLGGLARAKLQMLASYPVVFVGFSLDDTNVRKTLDDVVQAVRYRQAVGADGHPTDRHPIERVFPLNWYILLRAPLRTDPSRDEKKRRREETLQNSGVEVVWYQDGGEDAPHRAVFDIIQRIQREGRELTVTEEEPGFVERLLEAEELASVPSPTSSDVRRVLAVLQDHPRIAGAFWDRVDGLPWFHSLLDVGVIAPPGVIPVASGELQAPPWMAVGLLQRVARTSSSEVADFLQTVDTDNWRAVFGALQILKALDDPSGKTLSARIANWTVSAMTVDSTLLLSLSDTIRHLASEGKRDAALALLRATLSELDGADPTLPEWTAKHLVESAVPVLAEADAGLDIAASGLRRALAGRRPSPEEDDVRRIRPAIEEHRMNLREHSALDLFIDLNRDLLVATEDDVRRSQAVIHLLESAWPTEKRIGIAHCFLRRSDLPHHEGLVITAQNLRNPHLFHELAKLVAEGVDDLPESAIQVLADHMQWLHQRLASGDQAEYARWARILPPDLLPVPPPTAEEYDRDPDARLFRDFYMSEVFHPGAPLDSQSFASRADELSTAELLALVRDPAAAGLTVTWLHDADELWSLLADYAKEQDRLDLLLAITPQDLERNASWRAVEAMPDVAGSDPERWEYVLGWAQRVASEAPPDNLWSLGRLVQQSGKLVPLQLSEQLATVAFEVIEKTKRTSYDESAMVEDSLRGGYLNTPAGNAVQALFELLRRHLAEVATSPTADSGIPQWFNEGVLNPIATDTMELGIDVWLGLGLSYPILSAHEAPSVAFVARHVTPESGEFSRTAIGFWTGYLWTPGVYSDALAALREAYRASAPAMQEEVLEGDLKDRFFHHLVIGAVRDVEGYDDIILSTLSPDFSPATRGSIASSLGRGLEETAADPGTPFREVVTGWFLRYWSEHVERFGGQDGGELARYLPWLSHLSSPPSEIVALVEHSMEQAEDSFEVDKTVEYLTDYIDTEPTAVLRLLAQCVEWYRLKGQCWLDEQEVRNLLNGLAPLTRAEALLRQVLDGFAELGVLSPDEVQRYLTDHMA